MSYPRHRNLKSESVVRARDLPWIEVGEVRDVPVVTTNDLTAKSEATWKVDRWFRRIDCLEIDIVGDA